MTTDILTEIKLGDLFFFLVGFILFCRTFFLWHGFVKFFYTDDPPTQVFLLMLTDEIFEVCGCIQIDQHPQYFSVTYVWL